MSIVTSLVLSHPHITSHQLALGEAENVTFHRTATTDRAVPHFHPLSVNRADPLAEAEHKRLPGRWDSLWHSATVWRRKNEGAGPKEAHPAENGASAQPVAQTLRRRRDYLTGATGGTFMVTLKRFTALLLGAGFLVGSGNAAVMPQRRLPLGSGWLGSPAPFSLDDPSSELILRHTANAQSDGARLAIAKRQAPLLPRQQQVETFPLYTPIEKKYLESVAVVKQKNRVYLPILNHNPRKYGDGKLYRMQRKNRGHHFHRVRYADMDGKLIPVRVIRQPGQRVSYEIYDVRHPAAKGFPIKFDGAAWVFDKPPAEPLQTRHLPYRGGANRVNNLVSPPDMDHVFLRFG